MNNQLKQRRDRQFFEKCNARIYLIYLKAMKMCQKWDMWDMARRFDSWYNYHKILWNAKYPRLNGQGKMDGMMFIGVNPSTKSGLRNVWEDSFGLKFADLLKEAGINKDEIYFTNLYKYPTEENRPLTPEEIETGNFELMTEIIMVNPTVIVTLGKQPREKLKGEIHLRTDYDRNKVYSLFHPSLISRFPDKKVEFINQLKSAKQIHDKERFRREIIEVRKE